MEYGGYAPCNSPPASMLSHLLTRTGVWLAEAGDFVLV